MGNLSRRTEGATVMALGEIWFSRVLIPILISVWLFPASASGQDALMRSDLPLWTNQRDVMWPRRLEGELGCVSRIAEGDWYRSGQGVDHEWFRFSFGGSIHCFGAELRSEAYEGLDYAPTRLSMFVELGRGQGPEGPVELWALQSGARPGSDYLLLSSQPGLASIEAFNVLQRICPRANVRAGPAIDIARTDYCAINSRNELINLARRMVRLPPVGHLDLLPKQDQPLNPSPAR